MGKSFKKLLKFMKENMGLPILHGVRFLNQFVTCGLKNSRQLIIFFGVSTIHITYGSILLILSYIRRNTFGESSIMRWRYDNV